MRLMPFKNRFHLSPSTTTGRSHFCDGSDQDEKNQDANWLEEISIREALQKLNEREKLILSLRFFEGKTQMEVADEIGISQAQVSRLDKAALNHMRKHR